MLSRQKTSSTDMNSTATGAREPDYSSPACAVERDTTLPSLREVRCEQGGAELLGQGPRKWVLSLCAVPFYSPIVFDGGIPFLEEALAVTFECQAWPLTWLQVCSRRL